VKLTFAPKAILESIAEEQEAQVPRDFAEGDQPADTAPVSTDEPITAEPEKEPAETLGPDAEAKDGDKVGRTLH
jgi:hypothetical protein